MKRIIFTLSALILLSLPGVADDVDLPSNGDLWDNWNSTRDFYGQDKSVSDEDFDKAIDSIKNKQNKWIKRFKKMQTPKGEEFHQSNETEVITNQNSTKDDGLPVICIPIELHIGESVLPVGHYQLEAVKNEAGEVMLNFYQSKYLMAQVKGVETGEDFGEDMITFAKWIDEGDGKIKIIYGSLDMNAYSVVEY